MEIKAPEKFPDCVYGGGTHRSIFLAGSIEMGQAEDWQSEAAKLLDTWVVLNPRREDFPTTAHTEAAKAVFEEQVSWELTGLEIADAYLFYFAPYTKSPISLLELGLVAKTRGNIAVVCPDGFWRKGNVDMVCKRYRIPMYDTVAAACDMLNRP